MAKLEQQLTERLAQLIEESDNPLQEMQSVSSQLLEADLGNLNPGPKTSPRAFAAAAIEDNPQLREVLATHRVYLSSLDSLETPEQLINRLLPASSE